MDASVSPLSNGVVRIAVALTGAAAAALTILFLPRVAAIIVVPLAVAAGIWITIAAVASVRLRGTARLGVVQGVAGRAAARNIYDAETGFCSDWYFLLRLEEEVARSKRTGQNFALMIVEPRRRLGPRVRTRLLQCLESGFRSTDKVGRLGDARFAVLLVGCDAEGARAASRRITSPVGRRNIRTRAAAYPHDAPDWRGLLAAAGVTMTDLYPSAEGLWRPGGTSAFDQMAGQPDAA